MKVLVVGLGNIGSALARTIIRSGKHEVTVWNRSASKAQELFSAFPEESVEFQWTVAESLPDAISRADFIVISLVDYETAYRLFEMDPTNPTDVSSAAAHLQGKIVLQLTSSLPSESKEWSECVTSAGGQSVDGCVIGWPSMVGSDSFSLLISGCSSELFSQIQPILRIWGQPSLAGEKPGQADALDMGVLTYLQGIKFGFMQGLAMCQQAGVDPKIYLRFAQHYLQVYSSVLDNTAEKVQDKTYDREINTTVDILRTFNLNVLKHAENNNLSTEFLRAIDAPLSALHERSLGHLDQTAVYEYMINPKTPELD